MASPELKVRTNKVVKCAKPGCKSKPLGVMETEITKWIQLGWSQCDDCSNFFCPNHESQIIVQGNNEEGYVFQQCLECQRKESST